MSISITLIKPTEDMVKAVSVLNTGNVLMCYKLNESIVLETEEGKMPYIWQNNKWVSTHIKNI